MPTLNPPEDLVRSVMAAVTQAMAAGLTDQSDHHELLSYTVSRQHSWISAYIEHRFRGGMSLSRKLRDTTYQGARPLRTLRWRSSP